MNVKELAIEIEKQKKKIKASQDTIKILEKMIIAEQQTILKPLVAYSPHLGFIVIPCIFGK